MCTGDREGAGGQMIKNLSGCVIDLVQWATGKGGPRMSHGFQSGADGWVVCYLLRSELMEED